MTTLQKSYFNVQFRKNITYICSPGWKNQCSVKGLSKCYCSQKVLSLISKPPCLSKRDQSLKDENYVVQFILGLNFISLHLFQHTDYLIL